MFKSILGILTLAFITASCSSLSLNHALGTPKNPRSPFASLGPVNTQQDPEIEFLRPLYSVLLKASVDPSAYDVPQQQMRPYLAAGFALSDFYCQKFFTKTDEAYRRRSFGRATTNDVGTVVQSVLNLANAGKDLVTGVGVLTGLSDSIWRHYDTAFLISADLSNIQALVHADQDNFRARTLGQGAILPADYATAQSAILRYANVCSNLGMQDLLNRSASERREQLNRETEARNKGQVSTNPTGANADTGPAPVQQANPVSSDPALAPNSPGMAAVRDPVLITNLQLRDKFVGRWGAAGERVEWSRAAHQAIVELGQDLTQSTFTPSDINTYCVAYRQLDQARRQMFWAALLSSLAKRESNFRPAVKYVESFSDSEGKPVISRGLLQISYESANGYGCGIENPSELHDPTANLRCGVRIMNRLIPRAGVIASNSGGKWKGAAAYWAPFRKAVSREDIATWVRAQPYCVA